MFLEGDSVTDIRMLLERVSVRYIRMFLEGDSVTDIRMLLEGVL